MTQSIHVLDLLQHLVGPIAAVSGRMATRRHAIEVEDTAAALLQFENGALGTLTSATSVRPGAALAARRPRGTGDGGGERPVRQVPGLGGRGRARAAGPAGDHALAGHRRPLVVPADPPPGAASGHGGGGYVRDGPRCSMAREALRSLRVIQAIPALGPPRPRSPARRPRCPANRDPPAGVRPPDADSRRLPRPAEAGGTRAAPVIRHFRRVVRATEALAAGVLAGLALLVCVQGGRALPASGGARLDGGTRPVPPGLAGLPGRAGLPRPRHASGRGLPDAPALRAAPAPRPAPVVGGWSLAIVVLGARLLRVAALQTSPALGVSMVWPYLAVPVGGALLALVAAARLFDPSTGPAGAGTPAPTVPAGGAEGGPS